MARILIEAHHPSDIHFWKNVIRELQNRGHEVRMLARDRDVMLRLLQASPHIRFEAISRMGRSNRFPLGEFLQRQRGVFRTIRQFRPQVVASCFGSYTQAAWLFRKPNLVFTDSEFQHFNHRIAHPFATAVYTPACFTKALGRKHRRYKGFHELASLSPTYFQKRPETVRDLDPDGRGYAVLRVSAWNTLHDVGMKGLNSRLRDVIAQLDQHFTVWISPEEGKIDSDLENLRLVSSPELYHQVLAHARVVVTEGASTASEAAVLGVPTLYVNPSTRGYLDYLEARYGLLRQCREHAECANALNKLVEESAEPSLWPRRAKSLAEDHVDVVQFVTNAVEMETRL